MIIVPDSSLAAKWFAPEIYSAESRVVLARIYDGAIDPVAPEVILPETANAFRSHMSDGNMTRAQALEAWTLLQAVNIQLTKIDELLAEAVALAFRHNGGVMDGYYYALAQRLNCPLVTADGRSMRAYETLGRAIHIVDFVKTL